MEKNMDMMKFAPEPFKIKMVENMARLDKEERKKRSRLLVTIHSY